jgi:hypothetical protein
MPLMTRSPHDSRRHSRPDPAILVHDKRLLILSDYAAASSAWACLNGMEVEARALLCVTGDDER